MTTARLKRMICCHLATLFLLLTVAAARTAGAAQDRVLRLESIEVTGNRRATHTIIENHTELRPGDSVTAEALEADRMRLLATDYFKTVEFSTRPGSERGAVVLIIAVDEKSFPSFETGFGYHDLYGWFLTLGGLRFQNVFGAESQLRIGVRLGWRLAGMDAEYHQRLSRDGRYGFGLRGYVYGTDQRFYATDPQPAGEPAAWREFQQEIARAGAEAYFGAGDRRSALFSFGLRVESIEPDSSFKDVDSDLEYGPGELPSALQTDLGKVVQSGVFLRVVRDTRNTPVYPSAGMFSRFSLESNNTWMGGDQIFTRADADLRKYWHIRGGWVLGARLAGGIASTGTPYYDRFYIGGVYSIRGFANLSLSNPGGDDGYWLANAELRWRLAGGEPETPRVIGLVFVDAGQGYRRDESFDYHDIHAGAGWGMRFQVPWLGTLGFDAGVPLTDGRTNDPFQVHVSLGFSF